MSCLTELLVGETRAELIAATENKLPETVESWATDVAKVYLLGEEKELSEFNCLSLRIHAFL